jgi:uncharacterized protein (TIGR02246 family)
MRRWTVLTVDSRWRRWPFRCSVKGPQGGRAEIEQACIGQFADVYKGTSLKLTITNVRFLTPDVALVNAAFEVTGLRGPGGQPAPRKGMNTSILVRTKGEWLMTAHRGWVPPAPTAQ